MNGARRKIAFVLAASDQGSLIVNRFDYRPGTEGGSFGVGFDILENGAFDPEEVALATSLLGFRRRHFGDGVVAIDAGANIGVHTIEWARLMTGWGSVLAIEAQERIFYALAGNIALNNCFNARAVYAALGGDSSVLQIPIPDYRTPASFGSLELRQKPGNEFIGQPVDYSAARTVPVPCLPLDSLGLGRLDLLKLDIEGMESEALEGGRETLTRCRPIVLIEWIKSGKASLRGPLEAAGYRVFEVGMNLLAIHHQDPSLGHVRQQAPQPPG